MQLQNAAERFRQALREAKDRDSMLAVSREMLAEVEALAGTERADLISQRIAMLLPPETYALPAPSHMHDPLQQSAGHARTQVLQVCEVLDEL
jgi:hypothetical protein